MSNMLTDTMHAAKNGMESAKDGAMAALGTARDGVESALNAARTPIMNNETSSRSYTSRQARRSAIMLVGLAALSAACGRADPQQDPYGFSQEALLSGPSLGTAKDFAVLGGSTVTNTGSSTILGSLGVSPGLAITGFPPGIVTGGAIHPGDAAAGLAQDDVTTAYDALAADACDTDLTGQDLGGLTLTQGVYCFSSSAQLTGTLILDAQGDPDAVFIFQVGSTLTTASNASVAVINGGQSCNVFWQIGSSATLGTGTAFSGNILALTSITLATGASVAGRALARNGAVTLDQNDVAKASCASSGCNPSDSTIGSLDEAPGSTPAATTFKLLAGTTNGVFQGRFGYCDTADGVHVSATAVTSYTVTGPTSRLIQGQATVGGVPGFTFALDVTDGGLIDSFSLSVSNGYSASSPLPANNIAVTVISCP